MHYSKFNLIKTIYTLVLGFCTYIKWAAYFKNVFTKGLNVSDLNHASITQS